ncbi:CinA family protein [Hydrocarboniclastica marina]|uniref:Nicotinamide-nucleotide amidohydrolase family protein n=1 Tax=Hydrocarboniclastica marina TaxID=2259620 RepID=A0A4P7XET2_9ALTE|nr:nicotinamide-nucleotide amidohydrolase family protein [Hydrocarboniclastica marina]MAL96966.1 damage-inducible protein CinA [Alteromonadaceae bacterium]QCF25386.1 nicotinamide-nucleotide amidohydrolase family protein [Hydrocarboniclastica marina]
MVEPTDLALAEVLGELGDSLAERGLKVATAESCTGGWVAKVLTDRPGSSVYMDCGIVTYSNAAKVGLLGVSENVLDRFGAVSEPVAREMALGALAVSQADLSVAITGVAGPGGGTEEKPVGTVWFAWGRRGDQPEAASAHFEGDRDSIRRQAVLFALKGLQGLLR